MTTTATDSLAAAIARANAIGLHPERMESVKTAGASPMRRCSLTHTLNFGRTRRA